MRLLPFVWAGRLPPEPVFAGRSPSQSHKLCFRHKTARLPGALPCGWVGSVTEVPGERGQGWAAAGGLRGSGEMGLSAGDAASTGTTRDANAVPKTTAESHCPQARCCRGQDLLSAPLAAYGDQGRAAAGWGQPQPCPVLVPSYALQQNPAQPLSHPLLPGATGLSVPCAIQDTFSSSTGTSGDKECFCQLRAERVGVWEEEDEPGEGTGFGVPGESPPVPSPLRGPECWHLAGSWEVSEDARELGKAQQNNQPWRRRWWQQTDRE